MQGAVGVRMIHFEAPAAETGVNVLQYARKYIVGGLFGFQFAHAQDVGRIALEHILQIGQTRIGCSARIHQQVVGHDAQTVLRVCRKG